MAHLPNEILYDIVQFLHYRELKKIKDMPIMGEYAKKGVVIRACVNWVKDFKKKYYPDYPEIKNDWAERIRKSRFMVERIERDNRILSDEEKVKIFESRIIERLHHELYYIYCSLGLGPDGDIEYLKKMRGPLEKLVFGSTQWYLMRNWMMWQISIIISMKKEADQLELKLEGFINYDQRLIELYRSWEFQCARISKDCAKSS